MAAFSQDGKVVSVNDAVSIVGLVVSVVGSGGLAQVTVETDLTTATFVCAANDCQAVEHSADAAHPATSIAGKHFGVAGNQVSVMGRVASITGSGNTASLTVTLKSSGANIVVPAGAVRSHIFNG